MLFVKPLSKAEKISLEDMHKYHQLLWSRMRAHSILLSNKRYKIQDIADIYSVCRQSVSIWIKRWENEGIASLIDKQRSGRPSIISKKQEAHLLDAVVKNPRSLKKVISDFSRSHGIKISISKLKILCKSNGFIWKRVRKSLKSKRNKEEFEHMKKLIDKLIIEDKVRNIDLYYFDESSFSLVPNIPYAWQKKGEYIEIPCSRSQNLNVLGFINRRCQFQSHVFSNRIDSDVVIRCFDEFIKTTSKARKTIVLVDNAPTHTSNKFDAKTIEWMKKDLIVVPISRYSPELNIIEMLWRKIKYKWIPFSAYESFQKLETSLMDILAKIGTQYTIDFC